MATDYAEKEREFIASLEDDTGTGLDGWMLAIAGAGLPNRNDMIDWLRLQGFSFAKASWLERIHHNGGRLIYAGDPSAKRDMPDPEPEAPPPPVMIPAAPAADLSLRPLDGNVTKLLLAAKGLRPLAELVLGEIGRAIPQVAYVASAPLIIALAPKPFAALLPGPKQLKLYADFGASHDAQIKPAEAVLKAPAPFPAMIVINDARRVDQNFLDLIATAHVGAKA